MDRLLEAVEIVETRGVVTGAEVTSVELDSRAVAPGALFCCIPGHHVDGHEFAPDALAAGAVGLLVERPLELDAPQAVVARGTARAAMAQAAAALHGHPSDALTVVGVTGTNGKTTVTHLLAAIFEANGVPTSVLGTLHGARTTPESPVLQRLLAEARHEGKRALCMEVSSHALVERRVDAMHFAAGVFTNLSHDHLDYHGTMEAYFEAKATLFEPERCRLGIVNADDPHGLLLLERAAIPMVPFSRTGVDEVAVTPAGTTFRWRDHRVHMGLVGDFHVTNALAAATAASALGVPDDVVASGLGAAAGVPGRFELVPGAAPFSVVVDYAHTPDGLVTALRSARLLAGDHRVVCVFGAGGDRDREKRPAMGAAVAAGADLVVVTSDNPRSEDPARIIDEVLGGIGDGAEVVVEPDRRRAIAVAVARAEPGDVVLVAGKGHERTIEVAGTLLPFDDRAEAAAAVAARFGEVSA
jgi:UDP-N-acetylmuramoyl-L-alanyl-D-glutamate--2,6-diaminopimelate ligase